MVSLKVKKKNKLTLLLIKKTGVKLAMTGSNVNTATVLTCCLCLDLEEFYVAKLDFLRDLKWKIDRVRLAK